MALAPGQVRDAIDRALGAAHPEALTVAVIHREVCEDLGIAVPRSSVRSSLNLRSDTIERLGRGRYRLAR